MDNDRTGKIEAIWLRDTYNIIPIIIPNRYKVKDFAELVANNNFKTISDLIINTIQYIKEYEEKDKYFRPTFRGNDDLPY